MSGTVYGCIDLSVAIVEIGDFYPGRSVVLVYQIMCVQWNLKSCCHSGKEGTLYARHVTMESKSCTMAVEIIE